jgi:hypothetical protein
LRHGWRSALEAEAAATASDAGALELDQAADSAEGFLVAFAVEGGEHAGVVSERCDGWADAAAERLMAGAAAEIVVALGTGGLESCAR